MTSRGRLPASSFTPLAPLRTAAAGRPARSEGQARTPEKAALCVHTLPLAHVHTHARSHPSKGRMCSEVWAHILESHPPTQGRKRASQPRRRDQSPGSSSVRKERQRERERAGGHSGPTDPPHLRGGRPRRRCPGFRYRP